MIKSVLIDKICTKLQVNKNTPLLSTSTFSYSNLIDGLITFTTVKEASAYCEIPEAKIVQIIKKYLRPLVPDKGSRTRWSTSLLGLIDLKLCSRCLEILTIEEFYCNRNIVELDSICKICSKKRSNEDTEFNKDNIKYLTRHRYKASVRRARKIRATPIWADSVKIREIYNACPVGYHVDHIVPLKNNIVCGLHVHNNLQYLTATDNLTKSNKFEIMTEDYTAPIAIM